jgi:hypothetical protein
MDAFERRRHVIRHFRGSVSLLYYDPGYANYANLLSAGYRVRFFLNGVERDNATVADSEAGIITIGALERKGQVEIRLDKANCYLRDEATWRAS